MHLHTHGRLNPPDRCPIQGAYLKTGHLNILVFHPTEGPTTAEDYKFDNIDARQVSIPNMITLKVEWALYQTSKKFGLVHNVSQQAECTALKQLTSGDQNQPELQGISESLLYAKGEMLYNIKCPRIEASLDITSTDDCCYKYLPVVTGNPPVRRFLIPGSRLLSNVSKIEPCEDAQKVPRGYLSTGGYWVAADPRERVLSPPTELQLEVLTMPDTYEKEAKGGAYMDRDLAEWARVFTWDTRRTITQTYEDRISQSLGFLKPIPGGPHTRAIPELFELDGGPGNIHELHRSNPGIPHAEGTVPRISLQCCYMFLHGGHVYTWGIQVRPTVPHGESNRVGNHNNQAGLLCASSLPRG